MSLVLVIPSNEEIIFSVIPVLIILRWPCRYLSYLWPFLGSALAFYWFISSGLLFYICPVDVGRVCIVLYNMYVGPGEHSLLGNLAIVNIYLSLRLESFIPAFQLPTSDSKYRSCISLHCSLLVAECNAFDKTYYWRQTTGKLFRRGTCRWVPYSTTQSAAITICRYPLSLF